jgi:uncharacterized protein (DUF58 family)
MNRESSPPSGGQRRADLLPPETLAILGGLEFTARKVVEGALLGLHASPRRGISAEFAELRAYRAGDDFRLVDWRMVGRSDRWFVKEFHEDTHLSAMVLLDASASMEWSSDPGRLPTKFWYGRLLAASFGLLLLRQGDRVGFASFAERVDQWLPARGGRGQEARLLRRLAGVTASGRTEAGDPLREAALRLRRPGLVILVSDLLVDPPPVERALRYLAHRGHHVVVAHLMDPGERKLAGGGRAILRDPESGDRVRIAVADAREAYQASVDAALRRWKSALRPAGIEHHLVDTSLPPARALRALTRARGRG